MAAGIYCSTAAAEKKGKGGKSGGKDGEGREEAR